jgi:RNA polymerase sigma-70 factor (ECF subfamily)
MRSRSAARSQDDARCSAKKRVSGHVQPDVQAVSEQAPHLDELAPRRARSLDADGFVELLARSDVSHRRLAFRLLGDRDRMDDVLQEAYARAFRALPSFRGDASLETWLYRIVYNACIDDLRRRKAHEELSLEEWDERGAPLPAPEDRLDLAAALASLPAELRAVVLLVDAEGLSYAEAAHVLGAPAGTVASRLNRARAHLQAALKGVTS